MHVGLYQLIKDQKTEFLLKNNMIPFEDLIGKFIKKINRDITNSKILCSRINVSMQLCINRIIYVKYAKFYLDIGKIIIYCIDIDRQCRAVQNL